MKAKDYLKKIEILDIKINTRLEELESLKALATKTTGTMGGERVQSSSDQQKMASCVNRIVDLMDELNADIDYFVDYKRTALQIIDKHCTPDCISLLYKRYFQYKAWETIAHEMRLTYKWVAGGMHNKALAQLQKGLKEARHGEDRAENKSAC